MRGQTNLKSGVLLAAVRFLIKWRAGARSVSSMAEVVSYGPIYPMSALTIYMHQDPSTLSLTAISAAVTKTIPASASPAARNSASSVLPSAALIIIELSYNNLTAVLKKVSYSRAPVSPSLLTKMRSWSIAWTTEPLPQSIACESARTPWYPWKS